MALPLAIATNNCNGDRLLKAVFTRCRSQNSHSRVHTTMMRANHNSFNSLFLSKSHLRLKRCGYIIGLSQTKIIRHQSEKTIGWFDYNFAWFLRVKRHFYIRSNRVQNLIYFFRRNFCERKNNIKNNISALFQDFSLILLLLLTVYLPLIWKRLQLLYL